MTVDPAVVLTASARLGPLGPQGRVALADALGLVPRAKAPAPASQPDAAPVEAPLPDRPITVSEESHGTVTSKDLPPEPDVDLPAVRRGAKDREASGFYQTSVEELAPTTEQSSSAGAAAGIDLRAPVGLPPDPEPVLAGRRLDAVLLAALRRPQPWGEVRHGELVHRLAFGEPLAELPRRLVWSPCGPSRLVLHRGEAMVPFDIDAAVLRESFDRLGGSGTVVEVTTDLEPALHRVGRGTRVVALSDLGIGRPLMSRRRIAPARWHGLHRSLAGLGASLIVLSPFPKERRPLGPASRQAVTYTEHTTPRQVEQAIRRR